MASWEASKSAASPSAPWRARRRSDDRRRPDRHPRHRRREAADACHLTSVRLETGFVEERKPWLDAPAIAHTRIALKTLRIADGKIAGILGAKTAVPPGAAAFDAQRQRLLPTFRGMHIHLDQTFYGGPWQATLPTGHGRADRAAQERELLPLLAPLAQDRAAARLRLMQSQGTTVCRSHCNVDPVSKLGNLENLKASLARSQDTLDARDRPLPAARPSGLRQRRPDARGAPVRLDQPSRRRRPLRLRRRDGEVGRHDGRARRRLQRGRRPHHGPHGAEQAAPGQGGLQPRRCALGPLQARSSPPSPPA